MKNRKRQSWEMPGSVVSKASSVLLEFSVYREQMSHILTSLSNSFRNLAESFVETSVSQRAEPETGCRLDFPASGTVNLPCDSGWAPQPS